jgi:hypothetical protein
MLTGWTKPGHDRYWRSNKLQRACVFAKVAVNRKTATERNRLSGPYLLFDGTLEAYVFDSSCLNLLLNISCTKYTPIGNSR